MHELSVITVRPPVPRGSLSRQAGIASTEAVR